MRGGFTTHFQTTPRSVERGRPQIFADVLRIHIGMKHIKLFEDFGELEVDPYIPPVQIQCNKCGWNWNTLESDPDDMYICHKCGKNNKEFYFPSDDEE